VLRGEHPLAHRPQAGGRQFEEHLAHRTLLGAHPDVLGHVGVGADVRVALEGLQPPGEDLQERRLADAVGPDQAHVGTGAQLEGDVGEEQIAAGVRVSEVGDDHVGHDAP
jgi:hypothetical protein